MSEIDAIGLTRELVAFDTRNPPGREVECAAHLADLLEAHGFAVARHEFADGRTSLVAHLGRPGAGRPICFTGHIDTVPLGLRDWSVDPFGGEIRDGKLYGRGSTDMKSGVAAFVTASIAEHERLSEGPGVVLVITAGEETGCEGAIHLAKTDALGEAGAMIVAEPSSNYPFLGHKGALWLSATAAGVTAHGSMPEKGVNAAFKAGHMLRKLEDFGFNHKPHAIMGNPTLNVGTVSSGMNINSVPDHAAIGIDIRTVPDMDHARIRDGLAGYLAPDVAAIETTIDLDGVWTDPGVPFVDEVFRVVGSITGETPEPRSATYFTDASVLKPAYDAAPTVILGPGEAAMAHQTDEYCVVDRIPEAVSIYRGLITAWSDGDH